MAFATAQITQELKDWITSTCDMDLVGVADPALLADAPEGHRPADLLPGVKSVVVMGRRLTDGAVSGGMRRIEDDQMPSQSSYAAFARDLAPNFLLLKDTFQTAQYLERAYGEVAAAMPFGELQTGATGVLPMPYWVDPYAAGLPFDVNRAAVAAGLGQYGWSTEVLTPEYGPRVQFSAVLTTLELAFDAPYSGPRLCDPAACGICSRLCPTGAIKDPAACQAAHKGVVGAETEVTDFTRNSCIVASCALRKEFAGRIPVKDLVDTYDPTDEQIEDAFAQKAIQSLSLEHYPRYFCDRCLLYCPVGNWQERFGDTGLSQGPELVAEKMKSGFLEPAVAADHR